MADEALLRYLLQCEQDLSHVPQVASAAAPLASAAGGEALFRWELVALRYLVEHPATPGNGDVVNDDAVTETYGELLDRYRNHPGYVAKLRKVGERIRFLEDSGALPAAMIARAPRRP